MTFSGIFPESPSFLQKAIFSVFPDEKPAANFRGKIPYILISRLEEKGFLIKYLFQDSEHCYYRFSFGLPEENKRLKTALKELIEEYAPAPAVVKSPNPGEVKEEI